MMGSNNFISDMNNLGFFSSNPVCELYRGTQCEKYLRDKNIFIQANVSQTVIEAKLADAFRVIDISNSLSEQCALFVKPTLCYSAMPICKPGKSTEPELICQEDCKILEEDICKKEYAIAKKHDIIAQVIHFENCTILPSSNCRNLGLPVEPSDKSEICFRGDGREYRGVISETESGKKCIQWNQSHIRTANYTELLGGHNFCRNPGNSKRSKPWCFTYNDTLLVEESCKIPECEDTRFQSVLIGVVGVLTLLVLVFCYFCCSRRKNRQRKQEQMLSNKFKMSPGKTSIIKIKQGSDGSVSGSRREMSSLIPNSTSSSQKSEHRSPKVVEFSFSCIKFEEELGEGAFGKVYRGEITVNNGEKMLVAIKTLKENANSKTVGEFKREVELMSELRHPNIISLLGVCMTNRLCMLFEFMSHGDLHEYLIAHSPSQDVPRNYTESILEQEDLLNIAIQIAAGMEYLCSQHFVHRDLATRNCLVGDNLTVKISDFGLSRDVYSSDYYRVQKSALLPIRWMSPESILYGKFTVESDIWSYGVVLWEIYSYGLQPYYAHNNQDVVDMIRSHQVLTCPEGCPPRMYALMIECWNQVPNRRPQFAEIHSRLIQWRDTCSSSDKTDSTQLSHHISHKQPRFHSHLHSCPVLINK